MKPDWKDAPEWANWLSKDGNGEYWWWDDAPDAYAKELTWGPRFISSESICANVYGDNDAVMTLEPRP